MKADEVRGVLDRWLQEHRITCSDETCIEPLNMLAWLAHSFGMKTTHIGQFTAEPAAYEATCKNCQHTRN